MRLRARHAAEALAALLALIVIALLAVGVRVAPQVDLAAVIHTNAVAVTFGSTAMRGVADLAASDLVLGLTAVLALALALRRHWHGALALLMSVGATQGVVALIKALVARDRPPSEDAVVHAAGYSFPSAHSATSVAFYGVLALIVAHELGGRRGRGVAIAGAAALCIAVGFSRVYLGAHYPTDVVAGWLLGCVIALGSWRGAVALRGRAALALG